MSVNNALCTVLVCLVGVVVAHPYSKSPSSHSNSVWSGTPMDAVVEDLRLECSTQKDGLSCIKFKVLGLLDQALRKDSFKVSDDIEIVKNNAEEKEDSTGRGFTDQIESYIQSHDVQVQVPGSMFKGTTLTFSPRNLNNDELNLSVKLPSEESSSAMGTDRGIIKRRKSKLKKILIPILVFILLKALTLIPLAIGVLGLKAWNALQLSFFSFVISVALAIFQLCKKIAADNASIPQLTAHPWDHYAAARNLFVTPEEQVAAAASPLFAASVSSSATSSQDAAQDLAYNAYNSLSQRR